MDYPPGPNGPNRRNMEARSSQQYLSLPLRCPPESDGPSLDYVLSSKMLKQNPNDQQHPAWEEYSQPTSTLSSMIAANSFGTHIFDPFDFSDSFPGLSRENMEHRYAGERYDSCQAVQDLNADEVDFCDWSNPDRTSTGELNANEIGPFDWSNLGQTSNKEPILNRSTAWHIDFDHDINQNTFDWDNVIIPYDQYIDPQLFNIQAIADSRRRKLYRSQIQSTPQQYDFNRSKRMAATLGNNLQSDWHVPDQFLYSFDGTDSDAQDARVVNNNTVDQKVHQPMRGSVTIPGASAMQSSSLIDYTEQAPNRKRRPNIIDNTLTMPILRCEVLDTLASTLPHCLDQSSTHRVPDVTTDTDHTLSRVKTPSNSHPIKSVQHGALKGDYRSYLQDAVSAETVMPKCVIGAVELCTFFPNHTRWPRALLRLKRNGWTVKDIACAQLFARNRLQRTTLDKRNAALRHQITKAGQEYFGNPSFSCRTQVEMNDPVDDADASMWQPSTLIVNKLLRCPQSSLDNATLIDCARGVINWPQNEDVGLVTQCILLALRHRNEALRIEDVPSLIQCHQFKLPSEAGDCTIWDAQGRQRFLNAIEGSNVDD